MYPAPQLLVQNNLRTINVVDDINKLVGDTFKGFEVGIEHCGF